MEYEVRDGRIHLTGYVNAVGRDSKEIFTQRGRCVEQIQPGAFERALRNNPEVRMKLNHKRDVQAELTLIEDTIGLKADAYTDDEEVMMLAEKGELRGWSFGFDAISDELEERRGKSPRRIVKELNLREVSVLSIKPAYNGTSIEYRSEDAQAAQMRDEIAYRKAALCLAKRGVHIRPPRAREYRDSDESDTGLTDDADCGNIEVRDEQPREPAGTPQGGQFASKPGNESLNSEKQAILDNKDDIINAFKRSGFNGEIHIPPQNIDVNSLNYDNDHIKERNHNVSEKQAKEYIEDALISYSKTIDNIEYENYIGRNGAVYINKSTNTIRTAFSNSEYNKGVNRMLDTLNNIIVKDDNK